jgi:histidinol-phosphate/aromatic aminotransferase/cobyric acid decarboxylase-like protein
MDIYAHAERKKVSPRRIVDFTIPTNPVGPSEKAKNAMKRSLKSVALFPDARTPYLRRFIAQREDISPDNILFGPGATGILELFFSLLKPRRILAPQPLPPHYARLMERRGIDTVAFPVPADEPFRVDTGAFIDAAAHADTIVIPNPHPMTGAIVSEDDLNACMDALGQAGKFVVVDQSLAEFTGMRHSLRRIVESTDRIVLRSFSLFHSLAGMRLGYACGHRDLLDRIVAALDWGPPNNAAAAGALASLRDKGFYKRTERFIALEKKYLTSRAERTARFEIIDTPCNFVLVRINDAPPDLAGRLLQRNILIEMFADSRGTSFIHLPIHKRRDNARFIKTLERLLA